MVSLSNHVAISLRLSTCRGTIIATATILPLPYQVRGRNDMRKTERPCKVEQVLLTFLVIPAIPVIPAKAGIQRVERWLISGWLCLFGALDPGPVSNTG